MCENRSQRYIETFFCLLCCSRWWSRSSSHHRSAQVMRNERLCDEGTLRAEHSDSRHTHSHIVWVCVAGISSLLSPLKKKVFKICWSISGINALSLSHTHIHRLLWHTEPGVYIIIGIYSHEMKKMYKASQWSQPQSPTTSCCQERRQLPPGKCGSFHHQGCSRSWPQQIEISGTTVCT